MIKTPQCTLIRRSELIMPDNVNMLDNLMGGNLLRWMDITAAISAKKFAGMNCVTAGISHVTFNKAIKNGDIITVEAKVVRAFNTSMEIYVKVLTGNTPNIYANVTHEAFFNFVAIDNNLKPAKAPELVPVTKEEKKMFEEALIRRDIRTLLSSDSINPTRLLDYIQSKTPKNEC